MFYDPLYWLIMIVAIVVGLGSQLLVKGAVSRYMKVRASSGLSGAEAADQMLRSAGITNVRIEQGKGYLSDHYDPRSHTIRLSPEVYNGQSVAALGIACHEAGHAVQHARSYAPLVLRNAIVPIASIGSRLSIWLIIGGIFMLMGGMAFGESIAVLGVILFGTVVLFQVVNLPVEFDASARAKKLLPQLGMISGRDEAAGVNRVLNAAAMTYVAATAVALMQLLYWVSVLMRMRR